QPQNAPAEPPAALKDKKKYKEYTEAYEQPCGDQMFAAAGFAEPLCIGDRGVLIRRIRMHRRGHRTMKYLRETSAGGSIQSPIFHGFQKHGGGVGNILRAGEFIRTAARLAVRSDEKHRRRHVLREHA